MRRTEEQDHVTGGGGEGAAEVARDVTRVAKRTGRELAYEYALPAALAVSAGVVAGAIAVQVVGLVQSPKLTYSRIVGLKIQRGLCVIIGRKILDMFVCEDSVKRIIRT